MSNVLKVALLPLLLLHWMGQFVPVEGQGLKQGTQESISMLVKENVRGGRLIPIQKGEALVRTPGTSFDLDCHLEPGRDPEVEVSWWVNARRFRNKSRAKIIGWLPGNLYQDHQIRFHNFSHHDGGVYTCITSVGNVTATIAVEPVISQLTRHREVNSGEAALLQCKAGGYPRPKVFWTHLASGTRIASKILNLTRVEAKDGGEYECTAHNTHGQAKGKTMLTVSAPALAFLESVHESRRMVKQGSAAHFSCAVKDHPNMPATWYFSSPANKKQLGTDQVRLKSTDSQLIIESFDSADVGEYRCVVGPEGRQLRRSFDAQLVTDTAPDDTGSDQSLQCTPGKAPCSSGSALASSRTLLAFAAVTILAACL
eukprot:scpid11734/ scgid29100/ Down syndrome cell adhesion molecule homolog